VSWNLKGMQDADEPPYVYANNNDDIIVSVERKGWRSAGGSGIYYILLFKLVNRTDNWVKFNGINLNLLYINPDERKCAFPGSCGSTPPGCMQCFLNQQHPYSSDSVEYDHVYIKFWIWKYDIEAMIDGETYRLGTYSNSDRIRIKTSDTPVNTCFREEPAYHDIICQKYPDDGQLNTWIKKVSENRWSIYVGYTDDDDGLLSPLPVTLPVNESYCIEKKDKGWVSKTVTTLQATGDFSFVMDWIKNPQ